MSLVLLKAPEDCYIRIVFDILPDTTAKIFDLSRKTIFVYDEFSIERRGEAFVGYNGRFGASEIHMLIIDTVGNIYTYHAQSKQDLKDLMRIYTINQADESLDIDDFINTLRI